MSLVRLINISGPFLAMLAGLYLYRFLDKSLKLILIYVIAGFCAEILMWLAIKSGVRNTMPGLHFYVMFEFLIWAIFYMNQLNGYIKKHFMLILAAVFEIYCVVNMIFIQKLTEYTYTRSVENLLILFFAVLLYFKVMTEAKIEKLSRSPVIWINTAVLIYFAGNFFFNVAFISLLNKNSLFLKTMGTYGFVTFNTLYYLGIISGFVLQKFFVVKET